jgi:hypothetical protein
VNEQPGLLKDFLLIRPDAIDRHSSRRPGEGIGSAVVMLAMC